MNETVSQNDNATNGSDTAQSVKAHPFELAGMGCGPFSFVGMWSFPPDAVREANPEAYNNALREMPRLKGGCGTCSNCGMAIRNICIVSNAVGEVYGVGCDCVEKTGDPSLGDAAKIALAKHRRKLAAEKSDERRRAAHAKWLITPDPRTGETGAQRETRERVEREAMESECRKKQNDRESRFADLLPSLDKSNDFHRSLANQLRHGPLSYRQAMYVAKHFYSRRSNQFDLIIERCVGAAV